MDVSKPRLTSFHDLQDLVLELRKRGLGEISLYNRLTEIGIIDLDVLSEVIERSPATGDKAA